MLTLRIQQLIATLWAGSLWTIGYLVAPTLFAMLPDKHLAGVIAGSLFRIEAWLSIFCAIALIFLLKIHVAKRDVRQRRLLFGVILGMATCTVIGYFLLQPFMVMLRDTTELNGEMMKNARMQFGILHGISSVFYLIESLLAVILIMKITRE